MTQKHAIITGASRGIGKAIALRFAAEGWNVSICCHQSAPALAQTCEEIQQSGVRCVSFTGDMGCPEDAAQFVQTAVDTLGIPDVLVNNAGISHIGLLQDMTPEEWNHILQTNLSSVFYTCRAAIPRFLQSRRGAIINISSVWGNVGASMEVAYSASKGGVNAFTKALAKELAPSGIAVNAIACGIIDTSMNTFLTSDERAAILEKIPAGRLGTTQEVAQLVLQLADAPGYLTGQILTMDGGWC